MHRGNGGTWALFQCRMDPMLIKARISNWDFPEGSGQLLEHGSVT